MQRIPPVDFPALRRLVTAQAALNLYCGWEHTAVEGKSLRGPCPLHGSAPRSRSLKVTGPVWYCHKCRRGGDVVRLVELLFGLDAVRAAQRLSWDFRFELPRSLFTGR